MLLWTYACIYSFELVFWVSSDKFPEVEILGHKAVPFLIFWGNSILLSTVAAITLHLKLCNDRWEVCCVAFQCWRPGWAEIANENMGCSWYPGIQCREEKGRWAMGQVGHSRFPFKVKRKFDATIKPIYCSWLLEYLTMNTTVFPLFW